MLCWIAGLATFLGTGDSLRACICILPPHPLDAAARSEFVFLGEVLEVIETPGGPNSDAFRIAKIQPLEWFVGETDEDIIEIPLEEHSCGFNF